MTHREDADSNLGRALVVDDRPEGRERLAGRLIEAGFEISYAVDGVQAYGVFLRDAPDLVVTDWQMPGLNGLGLVRRIREFSDVPVVMTTTLGSIPDCEQAMRVGADRYLQIRRDLDRIGEIARELVQSTAPRARRAGAGPVGTAFTARSARRLARDELRRALARHLVECRGNIAEMARRMGKDRSTVRYHLRRMGMLEADPIADGPRPVAPQDGAPNAKRPD